MGYQRPCGDVYISDTWQGHKDRNPPSSEPGTDYAAPIGTPIRAAAAGTVVDRKTSNSAATGRYVTVALDDGRTVRYLHLSSVSISLGARVARGTVLGASGASANGSDWGVGAHVHTTLWPGAAWQAPTIDFERYVGDDQPKPPDEEEDEMSKNSGFYYTRSSDDRTVWYITNPGGYWLEWSDASMTVDSIAAAYDTGPFARVTEGMRNTAYASARDVRSSKSASSSSTQGTLTTPAWTATGLLGFIAIVQLVELVLTVVQR